MCGLARMTRGEALAVVLRSLAGGLGFVWLFGFAVGWSDPVSPFVVSTLAIGFLWGAFRAGRY